ncbi:hypothetical protein ACFFOM_02965 [Microlunatus capsulatus]|uniref:Uncharacterized protein n=1 Tax=Microlunatus capsulatus TaxID=99117 RepID=A0ABS4Z2N9_9ACTN|nr:hypothetical protein [Microlunatus capsulatus]MBP2415312.1 hypothetical protein [Microlunatus capsulatus]
MWSNRDEVQRLHNAVRGAALAVLLVSLTCILSAFDLGEPARVIGSRLLYVGIGAALLSAVLHARVGKLEHVDRLARHDRLHGAIERVRTEDAELLRRLEDNGRSGGDERAPGSSGTRR